MAISDTQIEDLRERSDIVSLIGERVDLRKSGKDYVGLCPLHGERTPSFYVIPTKRIFHCFGCGQTGDVFRFFMETDGMSFIEALRYVARESGIPLVEERENPEEIRRRKHEEKLAELMERAARFYEQKLWRPGGAPARKLLEGRGITEAIAREFRLGFAGTSRDELSRALHDAGIPTQHAIESGLCIAGRSGPFDRFHSRLIVPIAIPRPPKSRTVAFGGRLIDGLAPPSRSGFHNAKYINSPETPLYHKGRVLYALDKAREAIRREERVVVVEGYFDVIALHQAGIPLAVATCGTSLTTEHLDLLTRMAAKEVIFLFDSDKAGLNAATRAAQLCAQAQVPSRVATLPSGQDPDDFVRANGLDALQRLLDSAKPAIDLLIDNALGGVGPSASVEERVKAVGAVKSIVLHAPEGLSRELYVARIAERLRVPEAVVRTALLEPSPHESRATSTPSRQPARQRGPFRNTGGAASVRGAAGTGRRGMHSGPSHSPRHSPVREAPEGAGGWADGIQASPALADGFEPADYEEAEYGPPFASPNRGNSRRRGRFNDSRRGKAPRGDYRDDNFAPVGTNDGSSPVHEAASPGASIQRTYSLEEAVIVALLKYPVLATTVAQEGILGDFNDSGLRELGERVIACTAEEIPIDTASLLATLPLKQARELRTKLAEGEAPLDDYVAHLGRVLDRLRIEQQRRQRHATMLAHQRGLVPDDPASQQALAEETQRLLEESRRIHLRKQERERTPR